MSAVADASRATLARIERGLRMVTVPFPHLAGLVAATRVTLDERVPTMGVFASGRLVANAGFVARLKDPELVFVLAHEMLHLALHTHSRARGSERLEFNYAHDYIINDLLRVELGMPTIPAGGLDMPGARLRSAEEIVLEMRKRQAGAESKSRVWEGESVPLRKLMGGGAGDGEARADDAGDVLDADREKEMFPEDTDRQAADAKKMRELAARALALAAAAGALQAARGRGEGGAAQTVEALRGLYRTPWQVVLQRWIESVAPADRSFSRPSRRELPRDDVVLPGRKREGWRMNVVLDTSGSMTEVLPRTLGAIGDICDALAVDQVRLVQCDAQVTADEWLDPGELASHTLSGFGGSDLSPALLHLAADPDTRAVVVITDGDVGYPPEPMPYEVLWLLTTSAGAFAPPYGRVLALEAT